MYENGEKTGEKTTADYGFVATPGIYSNDLVMGRLEVDEDAQYATSRIDELTIWETTLNETQIQHVFELYGKMALFG